MKYLWYLLKNVAYTYADNVLLLAFVNRSLDVSLDKVFWQSLLLTDDSMLLHGICW